MVNIGEGSVNNPPRNINMTKSMPPARIFHAKRNFHPAPEKMRHACSQSLGIATQHLLFKSKLDLKYIILRKKTTDYLVFLINYGNSYHQTQKQWQIVNFLIFEYFRQQLDFSITKTHLWGHGIKPALTKCSCLGRSFPSISTISYSALKVLWPCCHVARVTW